MEQNPNLNELLDPIKVRVKDCSTYNFGMRNADKLAHDDSVRMVTALTKVSELMTEWFEKYGPGSDAERIMSKGKPQVVSVEHVVKEVKGIIQSCLEE